MRFPWFFAFLDERQMLVSAPRNIAPLNSRTKARETETKQRVGCHHLPTPGHASISALGMVAQAHASCQYAASFTAARPSVLVTVAAGYADGLIRAMAAKGRAAIAGIYVPFAGRISMDLLALDATDVPAAALVRGAEVEFLGDTVTLEEVAEAAGTITHEVLASMGPRAHRVYVDG